jgi:competence protein ComEA
MAKNMDLNVASAQDLERIQGIGKDQAKRFIDFRTQNGAFKSWEDVKRMPGVTHEILEMLKRNGFTVAGRAA